MLGNFGETQGFIWTQKQILKLDENIGNPILLRRRNQITVFSAGGNLYSFPSSKSLGVVTRARPIQQGSPVQGDVSVSDVTDQT